MPPKRKLLLVVNSPSNRYGMNSTNRPLRPHGFMENQKPNCDCIPSMPKSERKSTRFELVCTFPPGVSPNQEADASYSVVRPPWSCAANVRPPTDPTMMRRMDVIVLESIILNCVSCRQPFTTTLFDHSQRHIN